MKHIEKIEIQHSFKSNITDDFLVLFDVESDLKPTKPLLHKQSRFLYVVSGEGKIKVQTEEHQMKEGTIIALLPWQISEITEVKKPLTYYLLIYKFDIINTIIKNSLNISNEEFNMIQTLYNNNSVLVPENHRKRIETLFEDIRNEVGVLSKDIEIKPKKYSQIYLISKLTELIIYYFRFLEKRDYIEKKKIEPVSEEIFKYMYLNTSQELTLTKISKVFLMSESTISKYIKEMTGLGFYDLLREMKLSKAQFLLLHTNLTLDEIAKILQFTDSAHLSKIFSTNYGIGTKTFKNINKQIGELDTIKYNEESQSIINYIYDNYNENINIEDASKEFNVTPRYINKILKYYVEQNFHNFLNSIRINKSCDLLLNTSYNVTDIAMIVGFNSVKTFNRNFVKYMQMTPTEFRANILEQYY